MPRRARASRLDGRPLCSWWTISPALLILIFPLGFRLTCYYYRRSYYRAFWWSPPRARSPTPTGPTPGETRFPLIMQNLHRYFFFAGLVFNVLLTYDAVRAFHQPGIGWGVTVGTIVLVRQRRACCGRTR